MDSPVIVDTASKFGRDLDPGFPFDDGSFNKRDIRSHLDDLAARHPEFAEHLLGPPWGEIPFHGTLRNRRRGSGSHSQQGHPDEDARSQASGSSAASAASGASGVSSHGEPDLIYQQHQEVTGNNKIPQYGLRNTVDIGQHRHNMENLEKADRGQRSMSAPPENRPEDQFQEPNQNNFKQNHFQNQNQNPRFVSRVDITPQYTNQNQNPNTIPNTDQQSPQSQSPPQQQQQQQHHHHHQHHHQHQHQHQHQPQSNVRHIPIFVEGRDEPIISKGKAPPPYVRQQSPSRFYQPAFDSSHPEFNSSNYQRPSSQFNQHFGGRNRDWPSQFKEHFQDPFQDTFDHPTIRKTTHHNKSCHSPFKHDDRRRDQSPVYMKHQQEQPKRQESPKPRKQVLPTDPLEKVALVQNEVDSLTEQVKQWNGTSRKDKQYIYLDEMLTRELIKLDDIETEGKENVRQARKNAIKSIQDSISLLESKAPHQTTEIKQQEEQNPPESVEPMESETPVKKEEQQGAIPLPSPTKMEPVVDDSQPTNTDKSVNDALTTAETTAPGIPMETASEEKKSGDDRVMEVQPPVEIQTIQDTAELKKKNEANTKKEANETNPIKSPKKLKKAKKQTPVSIEPIPLPASEEQNRLAQ